VNVQDILHPFLNTESIASCLEVQELQAKTMHMESLLMWVLYYDLGDIQCPCKTLARVFCKLCLGIDVFTECRMPWGILADFAVVKRCLGHKDL